MAARPGFTIAGNDTTTGWPQGGVTEQTVCTNKGWNEALNKAQDEVGKNPAGSIAEITYYFLSGWTTKIWTFQAGKEVKYSNPSGQRRLVYHDQCVSKPTPNTIRIIEQPIPRQRSRPAKARETMLCGAPGFQRDGAGLLWCAVASTEWGDIPGKTNGDTCWFSYGGKEHTTDTFKIVPVNTKHKRAFGPPQGFQNDGTRGLWCAIAKTEFGKIPGKAKDGTCWYPYGGEEHITKNFKYAGFDKYDDSSDSNSDSDKEELAPGFQTDGAGRLWCAIAKTKWGQIPGKANRDTCWYSYGGKEYETSDFHFLKVRKTKKSPTGPPQGFQTDDGSGLWCAIAKTKWGKIPGKAKGNTCWFPYGGEEHTTDTFKFCG